MVTGFAAGLVEMFLLGVGTPLTAVCVVPLYPAFVAYLANSERPGGGSLSPLVVGALVVAGVIAFMGLVGVAFSRLFSGSLTGVSEVVSPIAFGVLVLVGLVLLADVDVFGRVPSVDPPRFQYPSATAFSYGFFFGAIVLPCNPGFIALLFARHPVHFDTQLQELGGFLAFGLGIGAPLLALAVLSESLGQRATRWLARRKSAINRLTGAIVLAVSAYYLVEIYEVVPAPLAGIALP